MRFVAEVVVSLKPVVNDPQGLVVRAGLQQLDSGQKLKMKVQTAAKGREATSIEMI